MNRFKQYMETANPQFKKGDKASINSTSLKLLSESMPKDQYKKLSDIAKKDMTGEVIEINSKEQSVKVRFNNITTWIGNKTLKRV